MPPKIIFLLFLLTPASFLTITKDPFIVKELIAQSLIILAFLVWSVSILEKKIIFKRPSLDVPMILFLAATLFSLKNAVHKILVFHFFFSQLLFILLYYMIVNLREQNDEKLILKGITIASLFSSIYGVMQYWGLDFINWSTTWGGRPGSTFGNPNFAAGWWIMVFPLFLERQISEKKFGRWFWTVLSILVALNIYWGQTRGAWIALVSAFFIAWVHKSAFEKKIRTIFISTIALLLLSASYFYSQRQAFNFQNLSILERTFKWATAWQMIKTSPLFGSGAGNLKVNFALYQSEVRKKDFFKTRLPFRATSESNVHNEYLQVWAEIGTIGFLSFLSIFGLWYWKFIKNWKNGQRENQSKKLAIFVSIISFLIFSLTNFPLHILPNACLLFFLLGISERFENSSNLIVSIPLKEKLSVKSKNYYLHVIGLIFFILIFWRWIRPPLQADYYRLRAEMSAAQGNYFQAIHLYKKVIDMDFYRSERTAYQLGECYRAVGQIQEAINAYEVSVKLRNYGEVYNNIGNCYYLLNNKSEAEKNWEKAVYLGLPDTDAQSQTEKNLKTLRAQ